MLEVDLIFLVEALIKVWNSLKDVDDDMKFEKEVNDNMHGLLSRRKGLRSTVKFGL